MQGSIRRGGDTTARQQKARRDTRSTFETSRCNTCNIKKQMKHLKYMSETLAKTREKHLKIIANICNIQIKHFATYV
jgi:queuine/archaeosine tRNA-ribosyltransferase